MKTTNVYEIYENLIINIFKLFILNNGVLNWIIFVIDCQSKL